MNTYSTIVYREHDCERKHRLHRAMASCIWPRAYWIACDGEWASVSYCGSRATVRLHETMDEALHSLAFIDKYACGGRCVRRHRLVRVVLP